MEECFRYYENLMTRRPDPHLHFSEDENCFADVVVQYKPLYYSMVTKYGFVGQQAIFDVYIDCILDCLKRYKEGYGKQTFGSYLKVAFKQGCLTEINKNNCDKRKANIQTYNYDDLFDENSVIDTYKDEQKLDYIIALCERNEFQNGLRR